MEAPYERRFAQLSRFVEARVTPELYRIWSVIRGLRVNIHMHVTRVVLPTYEENLKKPLWLKII